MKKTMPLLAVAGAMLLWSAAEAGAHGTPCCAAKPCPEGRTAVPGDSPDAAQCCHFPEDPAEEPDCIAVANAGYRCLLFDDDPAGMAGAIPERQGTAGCIDGDFSTCVGGTIDQEDGPAGCIGVGGLLYVTSSSQAEGTVAECTQDAVDACCAKDACEVAPDEVD